MNHHLFVILFTSTLLSLSSCEQPHGTRIGRFRNLQHGIEGEVYALDEKTLFIKDFEYDGAGPDAFFWAGTAGKPSSVGLILPYPFKGKFYEYEDGNAPILRGRFNKVKCYTKTLSFSSGRTH